MGLRCSLFGHEYIYQGVMSMEGSIYRCYTCNKCKHQKIVEVKYR